MYFAVIFSIRKVTNVATSVNILEVLLYVNSILYLLIDQVSFQISIFR